MTSWHSFPSIYNLGHRAVADLLQYPHVIEEKVDGSQFSFGVFQLPEDPTQYDLRIRSKGATMLVDAPEKMFIKAAETVKQLCEHLHVGWTYRGEYLAKPKHNALAYDRVPNGHIILFDVNTDEETWLSPVEKRAEAERLGLETVPVLAIDTIGGKTSLEDLRTILDETISILGGQHIEGVVVKPLIPLFGRDKKTLMGKFVSERFKEVHNKEWKKSNPTHRDILERLAETYTSPARWNKAIQHLREAGQLEQSPRDIGKLVREVPNDIKQEAEADIKDILFAWAWPHISRAVIRGLPEHYKNELLRVQFEQDGEIHDLP